MTGLTDPDDVVCTVASTPRLQALEAALAAVGSPIVTHPARPLSPTDIAGHLDSLGLVPPAGLVDWFGWRNGDNGPVEPAQRPDSNYFLGRMLALTIEQSVVHYRDMLRELGDVDTYAFGTGWFPILIGYRQNCTVCVDCLSQPGTIVLHDLTIGSPEETDDRICASVDELADLYVSAIANGWVSIDRTSPTFLDFAIDRVPRESWQPLLSL